MRAAFFISPYPEKRCIDRMMSDARRSRDGLGIREGVGMSGMSSSGNFSFIELCDKPSSFGCHVSVRKDKAWRALQRRLMFLLSRLVINVCASFDTFDQIGELKKKLPFHKPFLFYFILQLKFICQKGEFVAYHQVH